MLDKSVKIKLNTWEFQNLTDRLTIKLMPISVLGLLDFSSFSCCAAVADLDSQLRSVKLLVSLS